MRVAGRRTARIVLREVVIQRDIRQRSAITDLVEMKIPSPGCIFDAPGHQKAPSGANAPGRAEGGKTTVGIEDWHVCFREGGSVDDADIGRAGDGRQGVEIGAVGRHGLVLTTAEQEGDEGRPSVYESTGGKDLQLSVAVNGGHA